MTRTIFFAFAGWTVLSVGCGTVNLTVDSPPLPTIPSAENDLARADYVAMTQGKNGKGLLAVRLTNLTDAPIRVGGYQGAVVPTMGDDKAWLVFRGHSDVARFASTDLKVELKGTGETSVEIDVPDEGTYELPPHKSRIVLIGFQLAGDSKELAVDLQPLIMTESVHDDQGNLRPLVLRAPVVGLESIKQRAKNFLENTKLGFQLTSDDV